MGEFFLGGGGWIFELVLVVNTCSVIQIVIRRFG